MNDETEREIFELASEAKAHVNSLSEAVVTESSEESIETIKHNLELIERRTDPA